jgi:GMP synthase (glutamine-hydrolysing)
LIIFDIFYIILHMLQTFKKATAETLAEIAEEKKVRKTDELFLLFSMGSQFDHLIKQQLDALGVFCLVADPATVTADDVRMIKPVGIILSGGPASAYENPPFDGKIFDLGIPILGICLGYQMWAHHIGVKVTGSDKREFGTHLFNIVKPSKLLQGLPEKSKVLESHGDKISADGKLEILGETDNAPAAAGNYKHLWGVQFHPEVTESEYGTKILENFCFEICGAKDKFPAAEIAKQKIADLKKQIADKKVLLALSGGTDSSVVAYLLKAALFTTPSASQPPLLKEGGEAPRLSTSSGQGRSLSSLSKEEYPAKRGEVVENKSQILGIYIKGIDRPDDEANVLKYFGNQDWIKVKIVDATDKFLTALKGKISMRDKRLAMRGIYKEVLETEAKNFGADFIAQGTLYTDVSESGGGYDSGSKKAQIKIHHNVNLEFSLPEIEPLIDCVKDTGRNIGRSIGVPDELLVRHPFPGPGLIVRVEGEVTAEKLRIARQIDGIYIEELRKWKLYETLWQAGAVVTSSNTTCTKGDDSAEGHVIALWAVWSVNGFTARSAELPYDFLKHVSQRITNEIREVGGVVYRISDKPPVTIEWG